MKPVNLYPSDRPTGEPGAPNTALLGGAAGVFVIVLVVVVMTAFSRVDTIKSEAGKLQGDTSSAQQQTQAVEAQIISVGQPVLDSDKQLATNAEKQLVAAYTDRVDFKLMASELTAIMPKSGWYVEVQASATGAIDGASNASSGVVIVGYLPSAELAAAFDERVDATRSFRNARPTAITVENLRSRKTKKVGRYYKFTIAADFVDTVAPFKSSGADSGDASLVGSADAAPTLSLDSEPVEAKAAARAAAAPAAPKNAFEIAAGAAGGAK